MTKPVGARAVGGAAVDPKGDQGPYRRTPQIAGLWLAGKTGVWMRIFLSFIFGVTASAASAHLGHFGDIAGHDHWIAAGAIGVAGLVAVWGALKGKKAEEKAVEPEAADTDEEASA